MDTSQLMILIATWILMMVWLSFVAMSASAAFKKWNRTQGAMRLQMCCLWIGSVMVFAGDLLHLIGVTISTYTGDPTGPVTVAGAVFEFRTFSMFFDALVFIVYYTLWILFIVTRYQQGIFQFYDKISTGLAVAAVVLILPGVIPNALGIYSVNYIIAIWAPHITLFIIFGGMTVYKLIGCARAAMARHQTRSFGRRKRHCSVPGLVLLFHSCFFSSPCPLCPSMNCSACLWFPKPLPTCLLFII